MSTNVGRGPVTRLESRMRSARALTTKELRCSLAGLSVLTELSIHCGGIENESEGVQGEEATEEVKAERVDYDERM